MARHVFGLNFINELSDAEELAKRVPERMDPILQYIEEEKAREREIGVLGKFSRQTGWTKTGRMVRIAAGIPQALAGVIKQLDPEVFTDRKKFYAWLDANPAYDARQKVEG